MKSLSDPQQEPLFFDVPDAEIIYYPGFFERGKADELFARLRSETLWQQDSIRIFGKTCLQPRLTALYGNEGKAYAYSGINMQPHPWTPLMTYLKEQVEAVCHHHFTTVLVNQYRDGRDSMGWHSDNENALGCNPVIASLSFGAERRFDLKHNTDVSQKHSITLGHGSLLIMRGTTQHFWKHQLPKTTKIMSPRINLTFRTIK